MLFSAGDARTRFQRAIYTHYTYWRWNDVHKWNAVSTHDEQATFQKPDNRGRTDSIPVVHPRYPWTIASSYILTVAALLNSTRHARVQDVSRRKSNERRPLRKTERKSQPDCGDWSHPLERGGNSSQMTSCCVSTSTSPHFGQQSFQGVSSTTPNSGVSHRNDACLFSDPVVRTHAGHRNLTPNRQLHLSEVPHAHATGAMRHPLPTGPTTLPPGDSPQIGAERRSDAVTLRVEIISDLHRIARFALIDVIVSRRLGEKGVLSVLCANLSHALLRAGDEDRRFSGEHESPHPLVNGYRRFLQRVRQSSQNKS